MNAAVRQVAIIPGTPVIKPAFCADDELLRLVSEYEQALIHFARSLVRDADLARDCVQDTFLRAYVSLIGGRQVNSHWLFKVARNRATDELRSRRRLQTQSDLVVRVNSEGTNETRVTVKQTMDRLPRQYREVLYLFAVAGFKTDEIARLLETSGPAVRQRLYRARQEFRREYGDGDGEDHDL